MIMVSRFGNDSGEDVCIEAPLSGIPQGGCEPPPAMPVNGERFFHYSVSIGSHDSWCRLLRTYNGGLADGYGFAPNGWREWLRPDAFKVFLELTDDGVNCSYDGKTYNDSNSINGGVTAATNFRYSAADAFVDVDPRFYSARYLRAWQLQSLLAETLTERYDEDWWRNPRAGPWIVQALFGEGQRELAQEQAQRVAGKGLDFAAVIRGIERKLA